MVDVTICTVSVCSPWEALHGMIVPHHQCAMQSPSTGAGSGVGITGHQKLSCSPCTDVTFKNHFSLVGHSCSVSNHFSRSFFPKVLVLTMQIKNEMGLTSFDDGVGSFESF